MAPDTMNPDTLTQWQSGLGVSDMVFARYMGAPVNTVRNWQKGRRRPDAATVRLFDVLQRIERDAPLLHADLIREALGAGSAKPEPDRPHVAPDAVPDWLKSAI